MSASPTLCTLTGVDDFTPLEWLAKLSREYPFAEWGVLLSPGRAGHGRHPSLTWIGKLAAALQRHGSHAGVPRFALHLCGSAVTEFLANGAVLALASAFPRLQLNFRVGNIRLSDLRAALDRHPGQQIVTQHNVGNLPVATILGPSPNHALLHDGSGGHGVRPKRWLPPVEGFACGYAGGLGPDNLDEQLPSIHAAAGGAPYWIDMESSLRDARDRFDLDRARAVLETVHAFRAAQDAPVAG
jgi:hypothetical protein